MSTKNHQAAIGYVRVSTEAQASEGYSLDAQRAQLQSFAERGGLLLADVYVDEGLSGRRQHNRPALQKAMAAACERRAALVVYSLSRFARSTRDCLDLMERLQRAGATLKSVTEPIDTSSAHGVFLLSLLAALAKLESDITSERIRAVKSYLRGMGRWAGGHTPFGFDRCGPRGLGRQGWPGMRLKPNDAEQRVLRDVRARRRQGWSLTRIAAWLERRGIRAKRGGKWGANRVSELLARDRSCSWVRKGGAK